MTATLLHPLSVSGLSSTALTFGFSMSFQSDKNWRAAILSSPEYNALSLEDVNAAELLVAASGWRLPVSFSSDVKRRSSPTPIKAIGAGGQRAVSPIERTRRISAVSDAARRRFRSGGATSPNIKLKGKIGSQVWAELAKDVFADCIENIDPLDRSVKLSLFGELRGRNEAIAIVLSLATGRYFDRKDVSSHAQTVAKQPYFPACLKPRLTWPGPSAPLSTSSRGHKHATPSSNSQTLEGCRRYAERFVWPDVLLEHMGLGEGMDATHGRMPSHYPGPLSSPSSGSAGSVSGPGGTRPGLKSPKKFRPNLSTRPPTTAAQHRAAGSATSAASEHDEQHRPGSSHSIDSDLSMHSVGSIRSIQSLLSESAPAGGPEDVDRRDRASGSESSPLPLVLPPLEGRWSRPNSRSPELAETAHDVSSASEASNYANPLDMLADASDKVMRIENLVHPTDVKVEREVHSM